jgi:phenylacetic acid degradation protein
VTDDMIAWKSEGTRLYQQLPAQLFRTLKPCEPLREMPPGRGKQQMTYRTWHAIRGTTRDEDPGPSTSDLH